MEASALTRIGVLTSSRADYGIYKPLLKALKEDPSFELNIIAFGTHLSPYHGYTVDNIITDGYEVKYKVNSLLINDDKNAISTACALTSLKFADFWEQHALDFDLVFCLGDRFEMFGAVAAGIPYQIKFAHLHGGETTLGAIDNIYRHAITLASTLHFVSQEEFATRVSEVKGDHDNIFVTGALSLDNLKDIQFLSKKEFEDKWHIDLDIPTVLVTVHPETVAPELNSQHLYETLEALRFIAKEYQVVITMPNADTNGNVFREGFVSLKTELGNKLYLIENFGTQNYFTCMLYSKLLVGNTSSGIIEAASFNKYVLNLGDRQKGRATGNNVIHVPFIANKIKEAFNRAKLLGDYQDDNPYFKDGAAQNIIAVIKK
ncbi:UDP-N-acetylglucosamine 2-epimerase [Pontibacter sp. HSC-36F09]|uniref:UDP-N-acetylglucosamine 2-epimerase n=1 Tax=Pontibacter sp. HSC-36F09 TaxID=2910966 RepID=UPI00209D2BC8|nr:UDP-N-acetylglucosamine 2-epimerase [Pontibacter sp. HSC-36F09]MCP2043672.1 GDP/UDP-N,N'-diacetylbacillosamine 2-epimerase (hydrolyzing) [Pontibacter sp. HSC-36F09]